MIFKLLAIVVILFFYLFLVLITELSSRLNECYPLRPEEMFMASMRLDIPEGSSQPHRPGKFHGKKKRSEKS